MVKLKLSNIWSNFDDFLNLTESGNISTKHKIKVIKTFFDDNNIYEGNWDNLLNAIIEIFVNDKRIAKKFDYTDEQLLYFQTNFGKKYTEEGKKLFETLRERLKDNFYSGVQWGSPTKFYEEKNIIYLTKQIDVPLYCEIISNKLDKQNYYVNVYNETNKKLISKLLVTYINNEYNFTLNLETGSKTQISKYSEIIHFINANFFKIYLDNLSYNNFKYFCISFIKLGRLEVPNESNGYLSSVTASRVLFNLLDVYSYFENAETRYENIQFTYRMVSYNKFEIIRDSDEKLKKSIIDTEDDWSEKKRKRALSPRSSLNR